MDQQEPLPRDKDQETIYQKSVIMGLTFPWIERGEVGEVRLANENPNDEVASLIWRVLAFITDSLILLVPFLLLGYFFRDFAYSLGPYGRFIGYTFIISYFGIFNAGIRKGQTIGKWVWGIVVVDKDNNYLSVGKSFGRAFILFSIFLFSQWTLPVLQNPILSVVTTIIVIGGGFSLLYALIFNRTTRQGFHDLLVGSYVVREKRDKAKALPEIPSVHLALTFGLLGFGLVLWLGGALSVPVEGPTLELLREGELGMLFSSSDQQTSGLVEEDEWDGLSEFQAVLLENDEYFTVEVKRRIHMNVSDPALFQELHIDLWAKTSCQGNHDYCQRLIMETAEIAFEHFDNIEELDWVRITVFNHFDLGLSSGSFSQHDSRPIKDWRIALAE